MSNFWGAVHTMGGELITTSACSYAPVAMRLRPLRSLRLCVRIIMPHGLSVISVISVGDNKKNKISV